MSVHFHLLSHPCAITGEAPLWDATRQCLWWLDIQAQRLLRTTMDGHTQATPCPWQPGFVALGESGALVLGLETGLWRHDPDARTWEQVTNTEADRPNVRLNDGKPDQKGRLYFGSMDMSGTGQSIGRLYCRDSAGEVHVLREGVGVPNAIVPDADGASVWFTDSPTGWVERLILAADGLAVDRAERVFRTPEGTHPDGACLDKSGHLWLALIGSGRILRLTPDGAVLETHQAPISRATMPMLGGPAGDVLFVTCQRRFLTPEALGNEPWAGGLMSKSVAASAATVHRVAGL